MVDLKCFSVCKLAMGYKLLQDLLLKAVKCLLQNGCERTLWYLKTTGRELEGSWFKPLNSWPGLGTQICGEASGDLWVEIVK